MKEKNMTQPRHETDKHGRIRRPVWWVQVLIVSVTLLAVAVTVLFGRRAYKEGRFIALNQFNQQQLILARSAAASIETYFREVIASLASMAKIPSIQQMSPDCIRELEHLYKGFLPRTSIRRLDEHGVLRFVYPTHGWRASLINRNYGDEAFFRNARETGDISISGIVINEKGEERVRIALPVYLTEEGNDHNGQFKGVLVASFALDDISRVFISDIVSGETGYAWLMNQEGYFLAHHEKDFVGQDAFTVRAEKSPSLSFESINEIQRDVLAGAEGIGHYVSGWHRGQSGTIEKLVAYSPVHIINQIWSVSVAAPVSEVDRIFLKVEREATYGFGFIILVLVSAGSFLSVSAYRWSYSLEHEVARRTKELNETTDYLNNIIRFAKAPIVVWNTNRRITIFNPAFQKMSGRTADEMIGTSMELIFPDDTRTDSLRLVEEASAGNDWEDTEIPIVRRDGEIRTVVWRSYNIYDENGQTRIATFAYGDDITERKQAEEALRESQERLRLALDASSDGLWDWNLVTSEVYLTPRYFTMLGYEPSELEPISERWVTLMHLDDKDYVLKNVLACIKDELPYFEVEFRMQEKSGQWLWMLGRGKVVERDENGRAMRMIGTNVDITERKHAEEALRTTMRNLSMAQEMAQLGSWEWNIITDEVQWSDETYRLFGLRPNIIDVKLSTYIKKVHPDDVDDVRKAIRDALDGSGSYESEHRIIRTDGMVRIHHTKGEIECDDDGKPLRMVGIVQDITERRRALEEKEHLEAQLRHSQKMDSMGSLIAGVAHEINNPVNKIIFDIPLLQKIWCDVIPVLKVKADTEPEKKFGGLTYGFLKDNMEQLLADMELAANRVAKTVSNLKAYSRQSSITDRRPMQINTAVENSVRLIHTTLTKSGINLTLTLDDTMPPIDGNMESIEQAIMNVTINAVEAIDHNNGRIEITTGFLENDRRVYVSVSDNGRGIDPSIADKIFDPFITTRQDEGGTGLGLSITSNLVEAHGGTITCKTERGKGSTFTLFFPASGLE